VSKLGSHREKSRFAGRTQVLKPLTHRSLHLASPAKGKSEVRVIREASGELKRRDRLGGLIHEYSHAA
jgi:hypothetical protein